jgi:hypothetical protein
VVSASIKPFSPKISETICLVAFSFILILFFKYLVKFSLKCLIQWV